MDRSLVQFVYLLVAVACIFIIILGIQSSAYVINAILLASLITIAVLPIPTALIKRGWNAMLALIATLVVVVGVIILLLVLTSVSVGNLSEALANGSVEGVSSTAAEAGQDEQTTLERLNNLGSDEAASQALSTAIVFLGGVVGQSITVAYGQKTSYTTDFSRVKSTFVDGTTVAATRSSQLPCRTRQNAI